MQICACDMTNINVHKEKYWILSIFSLIDFFIKIVCGHFKKKTNCINNNNLQKNK